MAETISGETTARRRPRVGMVIGAGSVKCAAALGARRVLEEAGIQIDLVVGCSGGTIYAASIACGMSVEKTTEQTMNLWTRAVMEQKNRRALLQTMFPKLMKFGPRWGLRKSDMMARNMETAFEGQRIEETDIPLFFTATDFWTGEQVVLHEGPIAEAALASSAIPFVFPPVEIDGRLLLDGFLSDPLPVGVAIQEGADIIIALGFESPYQQRVTSAGRFARQMTAIMTNNLLNARYAFHSLAHHSEVFPIVPVFEKRVGIFSTEMIPYCIEKGEEATRAELPHILRNMEVLGEGGA